VEVSRLVHSNIADPDIEHSSVVGFFAVLLFVPETKALSLEELDQGLWEKLTLALLDLTPCEVFSVPTRVHATYQAKALFFNIKKYILGIKGSELPPLYKHERITRDMTKVEA